MILQLGKLGKDAFQLHEKRIKMSKKCKKSIDKLKFDKKQKI